MVPDPDNPDDDPPDGSGRSTDASGDTDDARPRDREEGGTRREEDRRPGWDRAGDRDGATRRADGTTVASDRERATRDPDEGGTGNEPRLREDPVGWFGRRLLAVGTSVLLSITGFVLAFLLFVVYQVILAVAFLGLGVELDGPLVTLLAGYVILQGIAFPTIAAGYLGFRWVLSKAADTEFPRNFVRIGLPSVWDVGWTVLGYVAVFVLVTASIVVVSLLNAPTAERGDQAVFQNPEALLLMIPISFLLIGPGEELLFRGIIQDRLRESFSAPSAILLASAMFAPLHVLALTGGLQALLTTVAVLFVPSLVFGVTYELSDNLAVPIVIHGAYDATIFGLSYLSLVAGLGIAVP